MQKKDAKILDQLKKIKEKKARLESKEQLLKEKNRENRIKRFIRVGSIAAKFNLDALDDEVLNGAFAELQEKAQHSPTLDEWRKKAKSLEEVSLLRLIISFANEPSDNLKKALKVKGFRQNPFRKKEWFGHGMKEEIQQLVQECDGKVEVAAD